MSLLKSVWGKVVLFYLLLTGGITILWITLNKAPVAWDAASHTWIALQILSSIKHLDVHGILTASNYYPIFIHTLTALMLLIAGPQVITAQYISVLYFIGTLFIIERYTTSHFKNPKLGFLTMVFFSLMPIVYDQAHWLMLDIPLTGMLFTAMYALDRSLFFSEKRWSMLFFIATACLIMTKWTGILFLVFPLLSLLMQKEFRQHLRMRLPTLFSGLAIMLVICFPWYWTNFHSLLDQAAISLSPDGGDPQHLFSLANITDYFLLFLNFQVTPLVALLVMTSSMYLLIRRSKQALTIIGSILAGYFLMTLIQNKDPRYTIPLLPYAGMLLALAWTTWEKQKKYLANILGWLFITLLFSMSIFLQFRPTSFPQIRTTIPVPLLGGVNLIDISDDLVRTYDPKPWPTDSLMQTLMRDSQNKKTEMLVGFEDEHLNPSMLQTYLKSYQLQGKLTSLSIKTPDIYFLHDTFGTDAFPSTAAMNIYLQKTQYVLVSPHDLGAQYLLRNTTALEQLQYYVQSPLPRCDAFTIRVAKPHTSCFVETGEELITGADVQLDQHVQKGPMHIEGFTIISCPWGCSFGIVKKVTAVKPFSVKLVQKYHLPDNETVNLYHIIHKH